MGLFNSLFDDCCLWYCSYTLEAAREEQIPSVGVLPVDGLATATLFSVCHSVGWSLILFTLCFLWCFSLFWSCGALCLKWCLLFSYCFWCYYISSTSLFILRRVTRRLLCSVCIRYISFSDHQKLSSIYQAIYCIIGNIKIEIIIILNYT